MVSKNQEEENNILVLMEMRMSYGLPYIHIECKRVEHLNIDEALNQAKRDHKEGTIPAVFHRKNGEKWKVTLDLDDFMNIYGEYYSSMILSGVDENG